jgi:hypothetical protein
MTQEALNVAAQCRATASSPLAKNILVDGGSGLLNELLLDAARIIEALAQPEQEPGTLRIDRLNQWLDASLKDRKPAREQPAQRKPLTDERIAQIIEDCKITLVNYCSDEKQTEFARAIEVAHGIKENT